jgi:NAD(P)H-dependent flavin oxidoreductase YrpB (nitropropane dioxygenase family)
VLAAGGIMTGGQMAAMMAAGAQGAWTGSVWLATPEAETSETFRAKMVAARSRDTVRSKSRTGKPARQLRTAWHEAWDDTAGPGTLPLTGRNVVDMIVTDLCVFHRPDHASPFRLVELAPGVSAEEVASKTTASYEVAL